MLYKSREKDARVYDLRTPSKEGTVQKEKKFEEFLVMSRKARTRRSPVRVLDQPKNLKERYNIILGKIMRKETF